MSSIKNLWQNFADKHPGASKWVREGGLFVIVSNLITVFKYLMLLFLPLAFAGLPNIDFGFPGIDITLFGETFKWNILFLCIHGCHGDLRLHQFPDPENFRVPQQGKYLVSGILVSDRILHRDLYRKLHQLYLGSSSRYVRAGLAVQYRNDRVKRRSFNGRIFLCQ